MLEFDPLFFIGSVVSLNSPNQQFLFAKTNLLRPVQSFSIQSLSSNALTLLARLRILVRDCWSEIAELIVCE